MLKKIYVVSGRSNAGYNFTNMRAFKKKHRAEEWVDELRKYEAKRPPSPPLNDTSMAWHKFNGAMARWRKSHPGSAHQAYDFQNFAAIPVEYYTE